MSTNHFYPDLLDGYIPYAILAAAAIFWLWSWPFEDITLDPAEPPLLKPRIPYIGHSIGVLYHHTSYYNKLLYVCPTSRTQSY